MAQLYPYNFTAGDGRRVTIYIPRQIPAGQTFTKQEYDDARGNGRYKMAPPQTAKPGGLPVQHVGGPSPFGALTPPAHQQKPAGVTGTPGQAARAAGGALYSALPKTPTDIISTGAELIPGKGPLATAGRFLGAEGAGLGYNLAREYLPQLGLQKFPSADLGNIALQVGAGELTGGAMRGGARALSALGNSGNRLLKWVGKTMPEFTDAARPKDIESVFSKIVGRGGQRQLSAEYEATLTNLLRRNGDPQLLIPNRRGLPTYVRFSQISKEIDSVRRSFGDPASELTRRKYGLVELNDVNRLEEHVMNEMQSHWPHEAYQVLIANDNAYHKGQAILRLFKGGPGRPTVGDVEREGGGLDFPTLQRNFANLRDDLQHALTKDEFNELNQIMMRGAKGVRQFDEPGKGFGASLHAPIGSFTPRAYVRRLPHLPRKVGAPEEVGGAAALAGREAGAATVRESK